MPWLGATADIIFLDINGQICSGEVKCPSSLDPRGKSPEKTLYDMDYITEGPEPNHPVLKSTHAYYLQVQLQMLLTKSDFCYFYIYSPNPNQNLCIKISRDDSFVWKEIMDLGKHYFTKLFPAVVEATLSN